MSVLRPGLSPILTQDVIDILRQKGVKTVLNFLDHDAEDLVKIAGISYKDVIAIRHVLLAQYSAVPVNGADLYEDTISSVAILQTGIQSLDVILDGGLYTSEVTEVVGPPGAGKSQLCMHASLNIARCVKLNVIYIDTAGDFCIQRLQEILDSNNVEDKELMDTLSRIRHSKSFDIFEVLTQLEKIIDHMTRQTDEFYQSLRLVIIDSLPAVVSPILGGGQTDGHGYLMHIARMVKTLAVDFNLAVMMTNNVVHGVSGNTKPALGRAWSHVPNNRIEIKRHEAPSIGQTIRTAVLTKCARQPTGLNSQFIITSSGVEPYHN